MHSTRSNAFLCTITPSALPQRLAIAVLAATAACAAIAQPDSASTAAPKDQIARIRTLYACSHFAKEVASIQEDETRRESLQKRVTTYASKASAQATALDTPFGEPNTRLVDAFTELGKSDFSAFMHTTVAIADTAERNAALNAFAARCDREAATP